MTPPTSIDGTDITGATIDGQDVEEITVDGQTVFGAYNPLVDDFEDGDLVPSGNWSAWSGNTGSYSASSGTTINGAFSLRGQSGPAAREITTTLGEKVTGDLTFNINNLGVDTDRSGDGGELGVFDGSTLIGYVGFTRGAGNNSDAMNWGVGPMKVGQPLDFRTGTAYNINGDNSCKLSFDFPNNEVEITVNGNVEYAAANFVNNASGIDKIACRVNDTNEGNSRAFLWDDIFIQQS
jgi:hypothetical protein